MILSTLDERYFLKGEDKCQISELIQSMFISLKDACIHSQSYANKERDRENWRIESPSSTSKRGAVVAPGCLLGPVSFPFKSYDMDECPGDDSPYLVPPPPPFPPTVPLPFPRLLPRSGGVTLLTGSLPDVPWSSRLPGNGRARRVRRENRQAIGPRVCPSSP